MKPQDDVKPDVGQSDSTAGLERGLPDYVTTGFSRAEWHNQAWTLYHAKTFEDTMLAKASMHTMRTVFDATFDALMAKRSNNEIEGSPLVGDPSRMEGSAP